MDTIFLATIIGWYLVIFGLFLFVKHEHVKSIMEDILASRGMFFLLAFITLLIGLLIVVSHNLWTYAWPVAITLFGWILFVGGVLRLFCSESAKNMGRKFIKHPMKMRVAGVFFFVFGLYLLSHVYDFHHLVKMS